MEHGWSILLHPLVEEIDLKYGSLLEVFFFICVLINPRVWIIYIFTSLGVPFFHFDLNTEEKSHFLRVELHVIGCCQLHKLGHLALLSVEHFRIESILRFLA